MQPNAYICTNIPYQEIAFCFVNYTKFYEAISMVQCLGRGLYLAKLDFRNALRLTAHFLNIN